MAALWWRSEVRPIHIGSSVGEYKNIISNKMREAGYSNIHVNAGEVAGGKGDSWVVVTYLHIMDNRFWEVIACSSSTADAARATVDEVYRLAHSIIFFD